MSHPLRDALVRVLNYVGVNSDAYLENFTATVPPFVMYTEIVRKLIRDISDKERTPFEKTFIQKRLTEFFLYTGYIIQCGMKLDELYDFHQVYCPIVWEHAACEDHCIEQINHANKWQTPFFAVHRKALINLNRVSTQLIAEFWYNRKLFGSKEAAVNFISDFCRACAPTQPHKSSASLKSLISAFPLVRVPPLDRAE
jgi:hypothetical protein